MKPRNFFSCFHFAIRLAIIAALMLLVSTRATRWTTWVPTTIAKSAHRPLYSSFLLIGGGFHTFQDCWVEIIGRFFITILRQFAKSISFLRFNVSLDCSRRDCNLFHGYTFFLSPRFHLTLLWERTDSFATHDIIQAMWFFKRLPNGLALRNILILEAFGNQPSIFVRHSDYWILKEPHIFYNTDELGDLFTATAFLRHIVHDFNRFTKFPFTSEFVVDLLSQDVACH